MVPNRPRGRTCQKAQVTASAWFDALLQTPMR